MPRDACQRRQIAERCWHVYDLINRTLTPAPEIHLEFPELVELAILSEALQMRVALSRG